MNWNKWVRHSHRWLSILFAAIVAAIFVAIGTGNEPAAWVYFLPLPPLALMMLTGLYMFFLPYVARRRGGRDVGMAG
jgi:ABC-type polysaccharide/polyol phosphate export permease